LKGCLNGGFQKYHTSGKGVKKGVAGFTYLPQSKLTFNLDDYGKKGSITIKVSGG
jgi:hypothetical protein